MSKATDRSAVIAENLARRAREEAARTARLAAAQQAQAKLTVPSGPKPKTAADLKMKPRAKDATRPMAVGTNGGAPGTGLSNGREERDAQRHERVVESMKLFVRAGLDPITGRPERQGLPSTETMRAMLGL